MHDPDNTIRIFARVWLGLLGTVAVASVAACALGTRESREARRRSIRQRWSGSGWMLLSLSLKFTGYAFPRNERHFSWLWIVAFGLAVLTWSIKGVRCLVRWHKRTRPVQTSYTRMIRGTRRKRP